MSSLLRQLHRHRRLVVWLSVVALLQMALMSWLSASMGSKDLSWLEICSAQAERSTASQDADSKGVLPAATSAQHCPWCSQHVPWLDTLNMAGLVVPRLNVGQQFVLARLPAPRLRLAWRPHTARAPPLTSSLH